MEFRIQWRFLKTLFHCFLTSSAARKSNVILILGPLNGTYFLLRNLKSFLYPHTLKFWNICALEGFFCCFFFFIFLSVHWVFVICKPMPSSSEKLHNSQDNFLSSFSPISSRTHHLGIVFPEIILFSYFLSLFISFCSCICKTSLTWSSKSSKYYFNSFIVLYNFLI